MFSLDTLRYILSYLWNSVSFIGRKYSLGACASLSSVISMVVYMSVFHKDLSFGGNSVLMLRPSLSTVSLVTKFAAAPWSATAFTLFLPISASGRVTQCVGLSLIFCSVYSN
ncbi:hypothetical protein BDF14DRAFT_1822002 [Spinellus fusiger]|nr:hypothetical protein BDF14DRAFT_1822002 [Spinellus fusiger]